MARSESVRYSFNRGLISQLALARVDLKRSALSAEIMTNWMARALGSMMLRPGLQYLFSTASNALPRYIAFVRSLTGMALLEFTNAALRIVVNTSGTDALLSRSAVSSAVANGDFTTNLASWTDNDEVGATSAFVAGGYMGLTGTGSAAAIRDQTVTVAAASQNVEHALRIVIQRGPVTLRVGSTAGGDEYITETTLYTGTHSLAFTPTGDFRIRFMSRLERIVLVNSCNVEGSGTISITSPYATADLDNIRANVDSLSVDVMFVACAGYTQRRIERRSARSWSIALYQPEDGPFRIANTGPITLTSSVLSGNGTLTASAALFKSTHAPSTNNGGALFRATSTGQTRSVTVTAQNQFSSAIRITGVGADRAFTINIDTVGAGTTIRLQRSLDSATGPWSDVSGRSWTAATNESYTDGLDNQIVWYRIGCKTGEYGVTTSICTLQTNFGSITGVGRVTAFTSSTVVDIEVLSAFGATTATDDWAEGRWSDLRGWPSAGTLYEGRLNWDGYDQISLSVSDQFDGFDPDTEGDSAPIDRTIGSGPLETINWALPLQRLVLGAQLAEHSVRSNAFDEPLTPTNFNRKACSEVGSSNVQAVKDGSRGMFVGRGGDRLYELFFNTESYDYDTNDLCELVPEIGDPRITRIAIQRKPDKRIHCIRSDGTAAVLVYNAKQEVLCWLEVESIAYNSSGVAIATGSIVDVVVLPGVAGAKEDQVYYAVQRTVNSATVVYLEKWAIESECAGGTLNKQADSFLLYSGASTVTITGLSHLEGLTVVVWGGGKDLGTYTVTGGQITPLSEAVTSAVVGLGYWAPWQSAKLGQTLSKHKNVSRLAPILKDTHAQGLEMGQDFDVMDNLPLMYRGAPVNTDSVYAEYDEASQAIPGKWDVDARVCMRAKAPRPCNVMALVIEGEVT